MTTTEPRRGEALRRRAIRQLSLTALILGTAPALAQNPQPGPPTSPIPPVAPPNAAKPPPEKIAPPSPSPTPSLSDHLSRRKGVLKPPSHVDPEMTVKPPRKGAGTMPVIPPPGTPGGNRSVVPK